MHEQHELLQEFLDTFFLVFEDDWKFTLDWLLSDMRKYVIATKGTFLTPQVDDPSDNWANRGHLLDVWQRLCAYAEWSPQDRYDRLDAARRAFEARQVQP